MNKEYAATPRGRRAFPTFRVDSLSVLVEHRFPVSTTVGKEIAATGNGDDVTLELRWELLRHRNILPARPRQAKEMSTEPAADPPDPRVKQFVTSQVGGCGAVVSGVLLQPPHFMPTSPTTVRAMRPTAAKKVTYAALSAFAFPELRLTRVVYTMTYSL